jgi:hypothetical protein
MAIIQRSRGAGGHPLSAAGSLHCEHDGERLLADEHSKWLAEGDAGDGRVALQHGKMLHDD